MELGGKPLHQDHIEQIIPYVPPRHLRSLSLTSMKMRNMTSKPKLWRNMNVSKNMISQQGLPHLFAIKRFEQVRVIDMSHVALTPQQLVENLNAISSSVEELNLRGLSILQVPAALLGQVAGKLHKLDIVWTRPTPEQFLAVLEACASSNTMTDLSLEWPPLLSTVPPQLLKQAVSRIHKLDFSWWTRPTTEQSLAVLEACSSSTTLKELTLRHSPLSSVPPPLLAQAVGSLHNVNLSFSRLTSDQCTAILGACASSSTINDVDLSQNNMSQVSTDLLGRAVGNLARVSLAYACLSTEQCLSVMEACISSSKLISVDLTGKALRGVPHQLLREAAENLQVINLSRLTMEQSLAILQASVSSSQLTGVSMTCTNFEEVPVDALTQAVTHLRHLNLTYSRMTALQKIGVLQAIIASSCTVTLTFGDRQDLGLTDGDIPALLLREARETGRLIERPW